MPLSRRELITTASGRGCATACGAASPAQAGEAAGQSKCDLDADPSTGVNEWAELRQSHFDAAVLIIRESGPRMFHSLTEQRLWTWYGKHNANHPRKVIGLYPKGETANEGKLKLVLAFKYTAGDPASFRLYAVGGRWRGCNRRQYATAAVNAIYQELASDSPKTNDTPYFGGADEIHFGNIRSSSFKEKSLLGMMLRCIDNNLTPHVSVSKAVNLPNTWNLKCEK